MSGTSAFDCWWAARSINDRLSFLHHDREMYTREGWDAGSFSERARLREKVEAMRKGAIADRTRAFNMEWAKDHTKLSERCDTLAEVLALLDEPAEART